MKNVTKAVPAKSPAVATSVDRSAAVRPPAIRIDWELGAPQAAVGFVEQAGLKSGILKDALQPGRGPDQVPAVHEGYKAIAGDVKAFLAGGKSSMTPYEATVLAKGLGFGGTDAVDASEKKRPYQRGDRVRFDLTLADGETIAQSGIAVQGGIMTTDPRNNRISLLYPEYDNGTGDRLHLENIVVTAQAKQDGKQERTFGA